MISFDDVMKVTRGVSSETALHDEEARALYEACCEVPRDGLVVEIGCQLGRSSSVIAQVGRARGYHSVHIDPFTSQPEYLKGWVEMMAQVGGDFEHEFTLLCMRTAQAEWLLARMGPIDLAYIDGDHTLPGVLMDVALVASRVRAGGLLTAHDYGRESLPDVWEGIRPCVTNGNWDEVTVAGTLGVWRRR